MLKSILKVINESLLSLLITATLFLGFLSLVGFGSGINWLLDLTNHFKPYYLMIQCILLGAFLVVKKRVWLFITFVFLLVNAFEILPFYMPAWRVTSGTGFVRLKLLQLNVCAPIKDYSRMTALLNEQKPNLVTLEECADRCVSFLEKDGVLTRYPYTLRKPEHRLMLLSQFPLKENLMPPLQANPAVAFVQLKVGLQPIDLFMMHSTRPSSGAPYYRNQIIQFHQIAERLKQSENPLLLAGDLNTTPWGYSLQKLSEESGLRNTMLNFGVQSSFPVFIPKVHWWATPVVPIDHVLVSKDWQVLNRRLGPYVGSDHLPVIVDLTLRPKSIHR